MVRVACWLLFAGLVRKMLLVLSLIAVGCSLCVVCCLRVFAVCFFCCLLCCGLFVVVGDCCCFVCALVLAGSWLVLVVDCCVAVAVLCAMRVVRWSWFVLRCVLVCAC